jgi:DNA invertase Pin-like site-specific DNA recombinase
MPPKARRFVAYYRVSTDRQGRSGLGLEAQRKAVLDYLNGGAWELIGEFTEVESGKRSENRPELAPPLEACQRQKGKLLDYPDGIGLHQRCEEPWVDSHPEFERSY